MATVSSISGNIRASGICSIPGNNIAFVETINHRIRSTTPEGSISFLSGGQEGNSDGFGDEASFKLPWGICAIPNSETGYRLIVADSFNHSLRSISPTGIVVTLAGGSSGNSDGMGEKASFNCPRNLCTDSRGHIVVADRDNNSIRTVTASGEVTTLAGGRRGNSNGNGKNASFNFPSDVCCDSNGNIIVADTNNHLIRSITPAGVVTTIAGNGQQGMKNGDVMKAQFNCPISVCCDSNDNIYVSDRDNHLIRVICQGTVNTLAGSERGNEDGLGKAAKFNEPRTIRINLQGQILISEPENSLIRVITLDHRDKKLKTIMQTNRTRKTKPTNVPLEVHPTVPVFQSNPYIIQTGPAPPPYPFYQTNPQQQQAMYYQQHPQQTTNPFLSQQPYQTMHPMQQQANNPLFAQQSQHGQNPQYTIFYSDPNQQQAQTFATNPQQQYYGIPQQGNYPQPPSYTS